MTKITPPEKSPPVTPSTDFGSKVAAHQRYYTSTGEQVPGVTTVLSVLAKPALIPWANRLGLAGIDSSKFVDEAASIGTLAHAMIMEELGGVTAHRSDFSADQIVRASHGVLVFRKWLEGHDLKPMLLEQPLVSDEHHYGGTIDILANLDGEPTLIDLKTSSGIYEEHIFQVGAYWKLCDEAGQKITGARILRIGRTEGDGMEERVLTGTQVLNAWKVFQHCLSIYALKKRNFV